LNIKYLSSLNIAIIRQFTDFHDCYFPTYNTVYQLINNPTQIVTYQAGSNAIA